MNVKSPIDELRAEHATILVEARQLKEALSEQARGAISAGGIAEIRERLERFRETMLLHFRKEEEGLFPDVRKMLSDGTLTVDILSQFFSEQAVDDLCAHSDMEDRMREMLDALSKAQQGGGLDDESLANLKQLVVSLQAVLKGHAAKEDTLVFPMIERLLEPEQMEAVRERLRELG
jgi:hemerythrin-like domain-containing protein